VLAPRKGEQRLNGIAISRGGCDIPERGYASDSREGKLLVWRHAAAMASIPDHEIRVAKQMLHQTASR